MVLHIHEGKCNTASLSQTSISARRITSRAENIKGKGRRMADDMMSIVYMLRKDMGDNELLVMRYP